MPTYARMSTVVIFSLLNMTVECHKMNLNEFTELTTDCELKRENCQSAIKEEIVKRDRCQS